MAPEYLFEDLSRDAAEDEVKKVGLQDGNFMVRSRAGGKPGYVMCVVYKSNPTHHLMVPNDDGFMTINKKTYGGAKTLEQLVAVLKKPIKGWPVPLKANAVNAANASAAPKKKGKRKEEGKRTEIIGKGKGSIISARSQHRQGGGKCTVEKGGREERNVLGEKARNCKEPICFGLGLQRKAVTSPYQAGGRRWLRD